MIGELGELHPKSGESASDLASLGTVIFHEFFSPRIGRWNATLRSRLNIQGFLDVR